MGVLVPGTVLPRRASHSGTVGMGGAATRGTQVLCRVERSAPNMLMVMPPLTT